MRHREGVKMPVSKGDETRHGENLGRLARVEGQVRGIRRMIEDGAYCVDIITQIQAAQSALAAIGKRILREHLDHCVVDAMRSRSRVEAGKKIDELMNILKRGLG